MEWPQWLEQVFRGNDFRHDERPHVEPLDIHFPAIPTIWAKEREVYGRHGTSTDAGPIPACPTYGNAQRLLAEDAAAGFLFLLPKVSVRKASI